MSLIGIIGAMSLEIDLLIDAITITEEKSIAGNTYYIGHINDKNIVLTCCGVGKVNAASSAQILISEFKVNGIINTGIAGGMHHSVNVCDIIVSSDVTHHDVRPEQMQSCYPYVKSFQSDEKLAEAAIESIKAIQLDGKYHIGRIVSGESFISDLNIKEEIMSKFDPHCVEMEGSAIGHVAHINKVPFVIIRSISDNADEEATVSYEEFEKNTAEQSSKVVIKMMNYI